MALSRTTLSAAVTVNDKTITIASISGLLVNSVIQVNGEKMRVLSVPSSATLPVGVLRGINGTKVSAHPVTSGVAFGDSGDFSNVVGFERRRQINAYSVAGAIALPTPGEDAVAILNGTTILAMTLANPGKDQDGDVLIISGNGKAAHTVTYTAGLGGNTTASDVITFNASQVGAVMLIAANEVWQLVGVVAGAATVAGPGLG